MSTWTFQAQIHKDYIKDRLALFTEFIKGMELSAGIYRARRSNHLSDWVDNRINRRQFYALKCKALIEMDRKQLLLTEGYQEHVMVITQLRLLKLQTANSVGTSAYFYGDPSDRTI